MRVAVIGGGISGLAAGFFLNNQGHDVHVFESGARPGGAVGSVREFVSGLGDVVVEQGPNGFLNNEPATLDLIEQLGLTSQMVFAGQESKARFIFFDGRLHRVPMGPGSLWSTELLTASGKFSLVKEAMVPPPPPIKEETVWEFAVRHFGAEIAERIVSPAILGIFGGDTKDLSVSRAFPRMVRSENLHRSLVRGMMAQKGGPAKMFSFKGGQQTLVDGVTDSLKERLWLSSEVAAARFEAGGWDLTFSNGEHVTFDHVVFAGGLRSLCRVFGKWLGDSLVERLESYPRSPLVSLSYLVPQDLGIRGFGVLISRRDNMKSLGILNPKSIFPGRAPEGTTLLTHIMGGVFDPEFVNQSDQDIQKAALADLTKVFNVSPPKVERAWVWRHSGGIPQYNRDFGPTLDQLRTALEEIPRFSNVSTLLDGVSMNDCIRKARAASLTLC